MPLRALCFYMREALKAKFPKEADDTYYKFATDVVLGRSVILALDTEAPIWLSLSYECPSQFCVIQYNLRDEPMC